MPEQSIHPRKIPSPGLKKTLWANDTLCLTEWEQLDGLKQRCETLEPPLYQNFKKSDYDLIDGIGKILLLAIRMEEVSPDDL